jgi:hypothetical protein
LRRAARLANSPAMHERRTAFTDDDDGTRAEPTAPVAA